jgi:hypothetical protein
LTVVQVHAGTVPRYHPRPAGEPQHVEPCLLYALLNAEFSPSPSKEDKRAFFARSEGKIIDDLNGPFYTPGHYPDLIVKRLRLRNDAQLVRKMEIGYVVFNRVQHGKASVTADFSMLVHDLTGISIGDQQPMLRLPRVSRRLHQQRCAFRRSVVDHGTGAVGSNAFVRHAGRTQGAKQPAIPLCLTCHCRGVAAQRMYLVR